MNTIFCPNCGKEIPEDALTCQFCQAEIKSSPKGETPAGSDGDPDWLHDLRERYGESVEISGNPDQPAPQPEKPELPEPDETPEWLQRIRERSQKEDAQGVYSSLFAEREKEAVETQETGSASETIKQIVSKDKPDGPPAGVFVPPAEADSRYDQFLAELRRRERGEFPLQPEADTSDQLAAEVEGAVAEMADTSAEPAIDLAPEAPADAPVIPDASADAGEEKAAETEAPVVAAAPYVAAVQEVPPAPVKRSLGQRIRDFFSGKKPEPAPAGKAEAGSSDAAAESRQDNQRSQPVESGETSQEGDAVDAESQPLTSSPAPPGTEPDAENETTSEPAILVASEPQDREPDAPLLEQDQPAEDKSEEQPEEQADDSGISAVPPAMDLPESRPEVAVEVPDAPLSEALEPPPNNAQETSPPDPLTSLFATKVLSIGQLNLTDREKTQSQLLDSLLRDTTIKSLLTPEKPSLRLRWIRAVAAIAFVLLLLYQLQFGKPLAPVAYLAPANSGSAFVSILGKIPTDAPLLLAFEFDPAYASEIGSAASPVLQRLMTNGNYLTMVSTNPAGPVLAENLANEAWVDLAAYNKDVAAGYAFSKQLINLGYLPGGLASLQALSRDLDSAVKSGFNDNYRREDSLAILHEDLRVSSINQFAAVILLTDRFESVQPWLEQVTPEITNVPVLIISTAQAAPLLRPYVDSGQIKGLLAGVNDGLMFTKAVELNPTHTTAMTAYYSGAVAIVLLFGLGVLLQIIASGGNEHEKGQQP